MKGKLFLLMSACILYASCGTSDDISAEAIEDNETTPDNPLPSGPKGTPNFAQPRCPFSTNRLLRHLCRNHEVQEDRLFFM